MKKSLFFLLFICSLSLLNGCGGGTTTPPPIVATHFSVTSATSAPTDGTAFMFTVTALGDSGQTATSYSGTVHFSSTDALAILPADMAITSVTATFSATLKTTGSQTITVTDTAKLTGTSSAIVVKSTGATQLVLSPSTFTATTGTPLSFTVTALDALNNTATGYSGTVHFTSNDPQAALPHDSTLTSGTGTFSVTLKTSGSESITATDTATSSITSGPVLISVSGPATHFSVTTVTNATTRTSNVVSVIPLDASNNAAASYIGTFHFTSTDPNAILPADANGGGPGSFQVFLETPGTRTVTVTDTITHSITGTSASITVTATPALAISSSSPPAGIVGSSYGPSTTVYEKCVLQFPSNTRSCSPCVPNTAACGGGSFPNCAHTSVTTPICILTVNFDGFELTGTGGVKPYKWTAASLPPGLSIIFTFPENLINGTPPPGSVGTYNAMVTLNDSGMPPTPMTMPYSIVINNPPPPVVSTTPFFPGATLNQPFSYTFTATAGLPPYQNWTEKGALPPGIAPLTSGAVLAGTPTMTGSFPITVAVDDSLGQMSAAQAFNFQVFQHGFKPNGSMGAARSQHTATLLNDGTVLLAGGLGVSSAEIYNPGTGKFTPTKGNMSVARKAHTATLLSDGRVLITGGNDGTNDLATAELYDPGTGMFTMTKGMMSAPRSGHQATLLTSAVNGNVLITNGSSSLTAELYNPSTEMFTKTTGTLSESFTTATLLTNGKVLFAGGFNGGAASSSAQLYDPATESFSATGSMTLARSAPTATLLSTGPNAGRVLVAEGNNNTASAELYDPTMGTFSSTGTLESIVPGFTATLLNDGPVLMAGGQDPTAGIEVTLAELYEPNSGTFTGTGGMVTGREAHTATLLKDGTVLVTGGVNGSGILATAEIYQ
jgi:hypothetical protein